MSGHRLYKYLPESDKERNFVYSGQLLGVLLDQRTKSASTDKDTVLNNAAGQLSVAAETNATEQLVCFSETSARCVDTYKPLRSQQPAATCIRDSSSACVR